MQAAAGTPAGELAEHLGGWLAWTDAIALAAVLPGGGDGAGPRAAGGAAARHGARRSAAALRDELTRLREELAGLRDELSRAIRTEAEAPVQDEVGAGDAAAYAPWRRRALALQRTMDTRIAALRKRVRAVLHSGPAPLRELAGLDAVLGDALQPRERHLLAAVPGLLERHARRAGTPAAATAGTWQALMQAELDLRLQPVLGLLDALDGHTAAAT